MLFKNDKISSIKIKFKCRNKDFGTNYLLAMHLWRSSLPKSQYQCLPDDRIFFRQHHKKVEKTLDENPIKKKREEEKDFDEGGNFVHNVPSYLLRNKRSS
jgi:hypothetical protein